MAYAPTCSTPISTSCWRPSIYTNLAAVSTNYSVTNYPPVNTTPFTIINLAALAETNGVNITNETDITDYFIITGGRVGTNSVITAVLDAASTPAFTNSPIAYNTNATYQVVTNTVYFSYMFTTNALRVYTAGFTPTTNTLAFDDFQMSQDFYIPCFNPPPVAVGAALRRRFRRRRQWSRLAGASQCGRHKPV